MGPGRSSAWPAKRGLVEQNGPAWSSPPKNDGLARRAFVRGHDGLAWWRRPSPVLDQRVRPPRRGQMAMAVACKIQRGLAAAASAASHTVTAGHPPPCAPIPRAAPHYVGKGVGVRWQTSTGYDFEKSGGVFFASAGHLVITESTTRGLLDRHQAGTTVGHRWRALGRRRLGLPRGSPRARGRCRGTPGITGGRSGRRHPKSLRAGSLSVGSRRTLRCRPACARPVQWLGPAGRRTGSEPGRASTLRG